MHRLLWQKFERKSCGSVLFLTEATSVFVSTGPGARYPQRLRSTLIRASSNCLVQPLGRDGVAHRACHNRLLRRRADSLTESIHVVGDFLDGERWFGPDCLGPFPALVAHV